MPFPEIKKIPARYIGKHSIRLSGGYQPYYDAEGKPLDTLDRHTGDTLMMPEHEVLGHTLFIDPRQQSDTQWLGIGRVILPEHQELSEAELAAIGYEFHQGRPDFEAIVQTQPAEASASGGSGGRKMKVVDADSDHAPAG